MEPKPEFLGRRFATLFEDASVAESYRYRSPSPSQTFEIINGLLRDEPRRVLDAGCGMGALARLLVIVESASSPPPWQGPLLEIFRRYSTNQGFQPFDLRDELVRRGLFSEQGRLQTNRVLFKQPVEEYVKAFHARSSFSRQRMKREDASAFDQAVGKLVRGYEPDTVPLEIYADLYWGRPHGKDT
jgi:hypothetical protein